MATEVQFCYTNTTEDIPVINNNYILTSSENKSKQLIYTCNLCKISATSLKVLQRHYEGRKHKMRFEREGKTFYCELCEVTANSQKQLDNHLKSSRHRYHQEKKNFAEKIKLNGSKGSCLVLFGIACIFINFLILFKMFL